MWLRWLRADDAPRLVELYRRLSPETIRRRFLREQPRFAPNEAQLLAAVDQIRRVAIAALSGPQADAQIVAVGRFHRADANDDHAELAMLVEDDYQRVGLGRVLLDALLEAARRRGLRVLDGYVQYGNNGMLRLLRTSGQPIEVVWSGGDVLSFELQVARQEPGGAPAGGGPDSAQQHAA